MRKFNKIKEEKFYSTLVRLCNFCGADVSWKKDKIVYFIRRRKGDNGIHNRKEWGGGKDRENFDLCKSCGDKLFKVRFRA